VPRHDVRGVDVTLDKLTVRERDEGARKDLLDT
jgi:hypothetical protein